MNAESSLGIKRPGLSSIEYERVARRAVKEREANYGVNLYQFFNDYLVKESCRGTYGTFEKYYSKAYDERQASKRYEEERRKRLEEEKTRIRINPTTGEEDPDIGMELGLLL